MAWRDEGRLHLVSVLDVASRPGARGSPSASDTTRAGLRRAGHGHRGPRRPGTRRGVPYRSGQRVHRPVVPGGLPAARRHPVGGTARVRARQRGHRVLALHLGVRAPLGGALPHQEGGPGQVAAWIEDYNTHRRHSTCQMMSPVNYEERRWRPDMPALLPPSRMRQCSGSSRSFLRGPDGPCGGSTWTRPALRRSYRARETTSGNKIRITKVSTVSGEPRMAS